MLISTRIEPDAREAASTPDSSGALLAVRHLAQAVVAAVAISLFLLLFTIQAGRPL